MKSVEAISAPAHAAGFLTFATPLLGDAHAQTELGRIERDDDFVAAAMRLASEWGIALAEAELRQRLYPSLMGISRHQIAALVLDRWPGPGWLPAQLLDTADLPVIEWAWFGDDPLRDSFFGSSAHRAASRPLSRLLCVRTSLETLVNRCEPGIPPSGFIFHMSRCGSTLAAQMLASLDHHLVASEPQPLDGVLAWLRKTSLAPEIQPLLLRAMISALGRHRAGAVRRFFVKVDSWHVLSLPQIRAAFPDVPWIFLYRDPIEVMVSQAWVRGLQTVAGVLPQQVFNIVDGERLPADTYIAEVLARTCEAVLDHWELGGGMLVNYSELPAAMYQRIPEHFGFTPDPDEEAAMRAASAYDAKAPGERFNPDSSEKQSAATPAIRAEAERLLAPLYARLEALRAAQMPRLAPAVPSL